jgi:hypothetical protein
MKNLNISHGRFLFLVSCSKDILTVHLNQLRGWIILEK